MEKVIIIACVALVLGIIAFGAYQLRKLRSRWADLKNANVHGKDADRIVYAYRVEEGYVRQRSRIWLLTIMVSAVVVLLGFGSAYYLHHKDVLAAAGSEMMEKFSSTLQSKFEKKELAKEQKNTSEPKDRKLHSEKNITYNKANAIPENAIQEERIAAYKAFLNKYFLLGIGIYLFFMVAMFGFIFYLMDLKE